MSDNNFLNGKSYEPLRRLLSDSKISELQTQIRVNKDIEDTNWNEKTIKLSELEKSSWQPKLLIAIDGDYSKSIIQNGFPGAEIGYITVSTVVILLDKVRELEKEQFIDPKQFRETEQPTSIDSLFVGCNVVLEGEDSAKSSMRKILFDELKKCYPQLNFPVEPEIDKKEEYKDLVLRGKTQNIKLPFLLKLNDYKSSILYWMKNLPIQPLIK